MRGLGGLGILLAAPSAWAHSPGLSQSEMRLDGADLVATVTLARQELVTLAPQLDADGDGLVALSELDPTVAAGALAEQVMVWADGERCAVARSQVRLIEEDGLLAQSVYRCHQAPAHLRLDFPLVDALAHGHRHVARLDAGAAPADFLVFRGQRQIEYAVPSAGRGASLGGYLTLGAAALVGLGWTRRAYRKLRRDRAGSHTAGP